MDVFCKGVLLQLFVLLVSHVFHYVVVFLVHWALMELFVVILVSLLFLLAIALYLVDFDHLVLLVEFFHQYFACALDVW